MTERRLRIAIAAFALLGLGIASYLTYVHYAHATVFCVSGGGGCETVQKSDQSQLAGIPVSVLGMVGYFLLLISAFVPGELGRMLGALTALIGFGFSAYLTYAELFVIHAICQWCVASAVVMTIQAILNTARFLTPSGRAELAYDH